MRGLFGALRDGIEGKATTLDWLPSFMTTPASKSGQNVNYKTALEAATSMACGRVLSEGIAQVPWKVFKARPTGGADEARDHDLFPLLHRRPNPWQTSFEFREQRMLHLVFCGNAFAFKNQVGSGRVAELIPFEPGTVQVTRRADLSLRYMVQGENGQQREIPAALMWHSRGPSWNGWMGLEGVKLAREAIGLGMALEESHARLHKNGAQPGGVYSIEGPLTEKQHGDLTKWIKDQTTGANSGSPLILDRGAKWLTQQMSGVDAQHVETRKFQIEEVCRFFRVFPQMVGHSDKTSTFASAESFFQAHVMHTLAPWAERWDQSGDVNLLSDEDAKQYFTKINLRGLLRGAIKDEAEYFAKALGSGGGRPWMKQDEVRGFYDLNPEGGEAAELGQPITGQAPAKPDPKED